MKPTHVVIDDGTVVPLTDDGHGQMARHDGTTIYVTAVRTSLARTPSHARWVNA